MYKRQADSFAILGGQKTKSGYYVGVVDFDVKNVSEKSVERGNQIIKKLPTTRTEQTPSGGYHFIFYCRKNPKTISGNRDAIGIELLGKDKLIIMAPSLGYKVVNVLSPTIIDSLEVTLEDAMKKAGVTTKQKNHEKSNKWLFFFDYLSSF